MSTVRQLPLFRHRHEPSEPIALDPVNAALDRIERDARIVIEADGEVALRARLARLLGDEDRPGARRCRAKAGRSAP